MCRAPTAHRCGTPPLRCRPSSRYVCPPSPADLLGVRRWLSLRPPCSPGPHQGRVVVGGLGGSRSGDAAQEASSRGRGSRPSSALTARRGPLSTRCRDQSVCWWLRRSGPRGGSASVAGLLCPGRAGFRGDPPAPFVSPSRLPGTSAETEEPDAWVGLLLFLGGGNTSPGRSGSPFTRGLMPQAAQPALSSRQGHTTGPTSRLPCRRHMSFSASRR